MMMMLMMMNMCKAPTRRLKALNKHNTHNVHRDYLPQNNSSENNGDGSFRYFKFLTHNRQIRFSLLTVRSRKGEKKRKKKIYNNHR